MTPKVSRRPVARHRSARPRRVAPLAAPRSVGRSGDALTFEGFQSRIAERRRRKRPPIHPRLVSLAVLCGGVLLLCALMFLGTGYDYSPIASVLASSTSTPSASTPTTSTSSLSPEDAAKVQRLEKKLTGMQIRKNYIVVDQANNRLYLRKGDTLLREAICSSGSGYVLKEGGDGRTWVFDSPQGEFHVRSKVDKPVWKKPDWAFVEAGEPIPRDPSKRLEYGVLGEHALYLGDGYMIHGTLYERLLGRSVTHGCVRLGKDDLHAVYESAPIGTRVFIY